MSSDPSPTTGMTDQTTPDDLTGPEYLEFVRLFSIEQRTEEAALRIILSRRECKHQEQAP